MNRFNVELRANVEGNTLRGHAAVFNRMAKVPQGYERLASTAFDAALESPDTDVRGLINHDPTLLLGRQSAGTLRLDVDKEGLAFELDLPDTTYARDLRELVARGDLTGASFGFIPGTDSWVSERGVRVREHTSVKALIDISAVTFPAYGDAHVALRHIAIPAPSLREQLIRARHRAIR